jgi:stage II sporulation protein D
VRLRLPDGRVEAIPLEAYVAAVIGAEMWAGPGATPAVARAALELQAVLSRTFVLASRGRHAVEGADVCTTTHCQVWRTPVSPSATAAALATAGSILTYEGRPAQALYHADCGGATSSAEAVWGGPAPPYLAGVRDDACRRLPERTWDLRLSGEALAAALDASPRTRVNGRLDGIRVLEHDPAGRARLVLLSGAVSPVVRGEELRMAIGAGRFRSLRFAVTRDGPMFVFRGSGFGHGAGLCQRGAIARLAAGESVASVVRHYFPGVVVAGGT